LLLSGAVPSVFPWSKTETPAAVQLGVRAKRRLLEGNKAEASSATTAVDFGDAVLPLAFDTVDMQCMEVTVETSGLSSTDRQCCASVGMQTDSEVKSDVQVQTDQSGMHAFLAFDNLCKDNVMLHYYTGLESADKLRSVYATLGPAVDHLTYYRTKTVSNISPINQFILMVVRIRQDIDYLPLSYMCGISQFTAQNIFVTWVNFCAKTWSEINVWPVQDLVRYYSPDDFKAKFPMTRVIVDGTEIPIKKPSNPRAQRATFSSYKNRNTAKVVVGSTPGGLISYVSPAYGGSASDRQIIERSGLPQMCDMGDSIMADKGFNVQDLFAANDVTVNIPSFFRKKNRMSGKQVLADRKIASKRVHIERLIGLMKTYKILLSPLPPAETALASQIVSVCVMLCNFRACIVPSTA
jgi:hypothetical protein